MANVPNARRYRTTGSSNASVSAAGDGWRHDEGGGYREAGPQAVQDGAPKWASICVLIAVLGFVALAVKFPVATLTVCAVAFVAKLSFGKK